MKRLIALAIAAFVGVGLVAGCTPTKTPAPSGVDNTPGSGGRPEWWYDQVDVNRGGTVLITCTDNGGNTASHLYTFPNSDFTGSPGLYDIYNWQLGFWGEGGTGHGGGPVLGRVHTCTVNSLSGPALGSTANAPHAGKATTPLPVTCTFTDTEQFVDQGIEVYQCAFRVAFQ